MSRRLILAAVAASIALAGCGSASDVERKPDGTCVVVRTNTGFGIEYSRNENPTNCPN